MCLGLGFYRNPKNLKSLIRQKLSLSLPDSTPPPKKKKKKKKTRCSFFSSVVSLSLFLFFFVSLKKLFGIFSSPLRLGEHFREKI